MRYIISITLALCFISAIAVNPGSIFGIREPVLNQIKNQYFDIIAIGFEFLAIEDFQDSYSGGTIEVTAINPDLNLKGKEAVKIGFDETRNNLVISVADSGLNVHLNWKDNSSGNSGVADIKGKIADITMNMSFDATHVNDTFRPKINFEQVSLNQNATDFTFNYVCDDCSEDVHNRITHAFEIKMFEHFESKALNIVNERISSIINLQLETLYPETFPLTSELSIDVGNTGVIQVKKDYIAVPIDSTIFLNKDGYNRPINAPAIDIVHPENPGEMILFTSDYVYKCISIIMNQYPMHFELPMYGTTVNIDVDGSKVPFELESEDGNMRLHAGGIISVPLYNSHLEFGVDTKLDLDIKGGNSYALLYLHPTLRQANFTSLKIKILGFSMDLSDHLIPYIDQIMEKILNAIFLPQFTIPKLEALPIKVNHAQLEFYEDFTELGFSFSQL